MNATKKIVKALVESEVGVKVAWVRWLTRKRIPGFMVSIWTAKTTDGKEWWVIPFPEATVFPAEPWPDLDRMFKRCIDMVLSLWKAEIAEQHREASSVRAPSVRPRCQ